VTVEADTLPIFRQQPNASTQSIVAEQWIRLILAYARHRNLFTLRIEDAETTGGDWDEILRNERIHSARKLNKSSEQTLTEPCAGRLLPSHLSFLFSEMVSKNLAVYEPPKQTRSVLLYWRLPEEWAEVLHGWVRILIGPRSSNF
jgi:ESCRT-II complex subunit VPS25